nr:hypothetical protein [Tanacetum cinerariifolium]
MSERFKKIKNDHAGCSEQVQLLEGQKSELSQVNKDQALKIKELEDTLVRKDSALVYAERIKAERAQEKERLVAQLSKSEIKKFDCICKLLPTVVERLFQSHEYKQSLSEPFNLAIQAGWGKELGEERFEKDLLALMSRMGGFDVYNDKKMRFEYDKQFEKKTLIYRRSLAASISLSLICSRFILTRLPPDRLLLTDPHLAKLPQSLLLLCNSFDLYI